MSRPSAAMVEELRGSRWPSDVELEALEHVPALWTAGTAPTTYLWTGTSDCPFCGHVHWECWRFAPEHTKVVCQRCGNAYVTDATGLWE